MGSKRITHHVRETVHAGNELRLIGQDCAVEILHDAADDIDQRRVIWIFMVHEDRALTNNLQGLTDGILFAKESLGQSLRDDTFIRCIEGCQFVSLKQIEIEEKEDETRDEETDGFVFNRTSLLSEPELESAAEDHDDLPSDSSEKYEEIGLLVDDLFRKSYGVLFYKVLFERHNELFKSLGIESPQAARVAIRAVRPQ